MFTNALFWAIVAAMDRVAEILCLLYDRREGFYSLGELASAAGMPRATLEAALEVLCQRGHRLEVSPAHGVRLAEPVHMDAHLIERDLGTRRVGRHAICFGEVDSTNDVAFSLARQAEADGVAVLAESQRAGRGRMGRSWLSKPGQSILMSVLLVDAEGLIAHEALTIAAGLAVAQGVEDAVGVSCTLKWPNDVLLESAKLAGVLVEIRRVRQRRCVVVGMGINVNAAPPSGSTTTPAICLADVVGHAAERLTLSRAVLRRLDQWVDHISRGRFEALHDEWMARCGMINERLRVQCEGHRYVGRVLDVSPAEGLILCDDQGRRVHLPAETSSTL